MILNALALMSAVFWTVGGVFLAFGWTRFEGVRKASDAAGQPEAEWPLVSVIIPARDEGESIRGTLTRLADSTYPNLEIVVVNDRSRDATGDIARGLRLSIPNLTVIDIDTLPELWLGKTHAMQTGYQRSRGEWLCFVDADVKMGPDCIPRSMAVVLDRELDHLSLFPSMEICGIGEGAFVMAFSFFFGAYLQPWKAKDPNSSKFCGVGAFNLIRRTSYEGIGTHEALRLEIADDLKLGKLIKRLCARARKKCVCGVELQPAPGRDSDGRSPGAERRPFRGGVDGRRLRALGLGCVGHNGCTCTWADRISDGNSMAILPGAPAGRASPGLEHMDVGFKGVEVWSCDLERHRLSIAPAAQVHGLRSQSCGPNPVS